MENSILNQTFRYSVFASAILAITSATLSNPAVAQQTRRLLFAQQSGDVCNIGYWHRSAPKLIILDRTAHCPSELFVDKLHRSVFFVDENVIRIVEIHPGTEPESIPLPNLDYRVWLNEMDLRPDQNDNYKPVGMMQPNGIRYLADGTLSVVLSVPMAAGDQYEYLFRYSNGDWSIDASGWCDSWGCENPDEPSHPFYSEHFFSTGNSSGWPEERQAWHPDLIRNRYVFSRTEETDEDSPERYEASLVTLRLKIAGKRSLLASTNWVSEHTGKLNTFGMTLTIDSGVPKILSERQSMTSIVGRYILVRGGGRFELTDLGTGGTVLSELSAAAWID